MKPYWSFGDRIKPVELTRGVDFMCGCIYGLTRSLTVLYDRYQVFKSFKLESYTAFTDTLEWPECNSDKATVGSVVCTVYTDSKPYKPCVLCETGLTGSVFLRKT